MFKNLICSRRKNNKLKADRAANRLRNRTRLLQGMQLLEDRRLLAVTTLPFYAVADFNQFTGSTDPDDVAIGFGVQDGPNGVPNDPEFLGIDFKNNVEIGGFTTGFFGPVGAKGAIAGDGKLGLEYGYYISKGAGSIVNEGTFQYDIVPNDTGTFNLLTGSIVSESSISTISPTISAYADIILELDATVEGQLCAGILGCTVDPRVPEKVEGETLTKGDGAFRLDIDQTIPLASINRQTQDSIDSFADGNGFVDFDGDLKLLGISLLDNDDLVRDFFSSKSLLEAATANESKAVHDLENADTPESRAKARDALKEAQATKTQETAKQAALQNEIVQKQGDETKDDGSGLGLVVGPASNNRFGVKVSASQSASVLGGQVGIGKPLGSLSLTLPEVNLTNSTGSDGDLFASTKDPIFNQVQGENGLEDGPLKGQNEIANLSLNVGTFLSNQIPGLGTTSISVGPVSVSLTTADYILSAILDVQQDIEALFDQEIVYAAFNEDPGAEGDLLSITAAEVAEHFPDLSASDIGHVIKFVKGADVTISSANFTDDLEVDFVLGRSYDIKNDIALGLSLKGKLEVLKASAEVDFGPLNQSLFDIGPVIELNQNLAGIDIPVFEVDDFQAQATAAFPPQTVILRPDISTTIGNTSEIIVDDDGLGLASDGKFSFDVVLENKGLLAAQPSTLDLTQLNLDGGDFRTDSDIGAIDSNSSGNAARTFEFEEDFSIEPGESVTITFEGTTTLSGGETFDAIATIFSTDDAVANNNSATTNLRVLKSRQFIVSRGDDDTPTAGLACTQQTVGSAPCSLREAVEAANNFDGDNARVIVIGEGVPTVTLESGIVLQESVAIFGQGIDATKIQAHPTLFPAGDSLFANFISKSPSNPTGTFFNSDLQFSQLELSGSTTSGPAISSFLNSLDINDLRFSDNDRFGALFTVGADVTIQDSEFIDNQSIGQDIDGQDVGGGAITAASGLMSITNTRFEGNEAAFAGAIQVDKSQVIQINDSIFTGNTASDPAGGIIQSINADNPIGGVNQISANSVLLYNNNGNNFANVTLVEFSQDWDNAAGALGAQFIETGITSPTQADIGQYDEATGGGISYEFVYTAPELDSDGTVLLGFIDDNGNRVSLNLENSAFFRQYGVTEGNSLFGSGVDSIADELTHIVFVADGTSMDLYVNGVFALTLPGNASVNLSGQVGIGQALNRGTQDGTLGLTEGTIHGFAAYDRALNSDEIADLSIASRGTFENVSDDLSIDFSTNDIDSFGSRNVDSLIQLSQIASVGDLTGLPEDAALVLANTPGVELSDVIWQVPSRQIGDSRVIAEPSNPESALFEIVNEVLKLKAGEQLPDDGGVFEINIEGTDASGQKFVDSVRIIAIAPPVQPAAVTATPIPGFTDVTDGVQSVVGTQVEVSWDQVQADTEYIIRAATTDNVLQVGADGVTMFRGPSDTRVLRFQANDLTEPLAAFVNLKFATEYEFSVQAVNVLARSTESVSNEITTFDAPPAAINNLKATGTSTEINLSFDASLRATSYELYLIDEIAEIEEDEFGQSNFNVVSREETQLATLADDAANSDGIIEISSLDLPGLNVTPDTLYHFEVRAINVSGTAVGQIIIESDKPKPTAPQDVSVVVVSQTSARLTWSDSINESQYQIVGKANGEADFSSLLLPNQVVSAGQTEVQVTGLLPNRTYEFMVIAANEDDNNASAIVTGQTSTELDSLFVTTAEDSFDPTDFRTSLREAIAFADEKINLDGQFRGDSDGDGFSHDTITFDTSGVFSTPQTIFLDSQIRIRESLTIIGSEGIEISGRDENRIFESLVQGTDLTLQNLVLRDGLSRETPTRGGGFEGSGGAILMGAGALTLIDTTIQSSIATSADPQSPAEGGAIRTIGPVKLIRSAIIDNEAIGSSASGGGIHTISGIELTNSFVDGNQTQASTGYSQGGGLASLQTVSLDQSTVSNNQANGGGSGLNFSGGGGIYSRSRVTLDQSVVRDNQTNGTNAAGGGIRSGSSAGGTVTSTNSSLSGNVTTGSGASGGAVSTRAIYFTNTTIAGNRADNASASGGGIYARDVTLTNVTITGNVTGGAGGGVLATNSTKLSSSLILGNYASNGENELQLLTGTPELLDANIFGIEVDSNNNPIDPVDIFEDTVFVVGGVRAGVLGDNNAPGTVGGPTNTVVQTAALQTDFTSLNLALDRNPVDPSSLVVRDARGSERSSDLPGVFQGGTVDLGAFEVGVDLIVTTLSDSANSPGQLTLREAIESANLRSGDDVITFSPGLSGQTISLGSQLPVVTQGLLIDASELNQPLTLAAGFQSRIIAFDSGDDSELNNLVLTGGRVVPANASSNDDTNSGGAINFNSTGGTLRLTDTQFTNNATLNNHARGGAIFASDDSTLEIYRSTFTNNYTVGDDASGGAIHAGSVVLNQTNTFSGNFTSAPRSPGGAVFADNLYANYIRNYTGLFPGEGSVFDSNFTGGNSSPGGALYIVGQGRLSNIRFTDNYTTGEDSPGGAIYSGGFLNLRERSVVESNQTRGTDSGGGAIAGGSSVGVYESSVLANQTLGANSPGGGIFATNESSPDDGQAGYVSVTRGTLARNRTRGANSPGGGAVSRGFYAYQGTIADNGTAGNNSPGGGVSTVRLNSSLGTFTGNSTSATLAGTSPGGGIFASDPDNVRSFQNSILGNYANNSPDNDLSSPSPLFYGFNLVGSSSSDHVPTFIPASYAGGIDNLSVNADAANIFVSVGDVAFDSDADGIPDTAILGRKAGQLENLGGGLLTVGLKPDQLNNLALDRVSTPLVTDANGNQRTVVLTQGSAPPQAFAAAPSFASVASQSLGEIAVGFAFAASSAATTSLPSAGGADVGATELQSLTPEQQRLVVDTLEDVSDPLDLRTSLREAIALADEGDIDGINGELDVIRFDPSLAGKRLSLVEFELDIEKSLIIDASAIGGITIDANELSRVLHFDAPSGDLILKAITITGGSVENEEGGGIRFDSNGRLTLESSRVTVNQTTGNDAGGGGIYALGNVTLTDSLIDQNTTTGDDSPGGGLLVGRTATINNSTVFNNSTAGLRSSGGGASANTLTATNTTVVDNDVLGDQATAGGLHSVESTTLHNSIVLGNNSASAIDTSELNRDTLLSFQDGNIVGTGLTTFNANGNSAINAELLDVFTSVELQLDGGLTPTLALNPSPLNPALDAGRLANAETLTDQRGLPRLVDLSGILGGAPIDLGAYELQAGIEESRSLVVTTNSDVVDESDFATSLREALAFADDLTVADNGDADGDELVNDTVTFDTSLNGSTITVGQRVIDRVIGDH